MRKILLFSAILLLFLAGCQQQTTTTTGATPFIEGEKAVDIKFLDSTPSEIFDASDPSNTATFYPFEIGLQIENLGETDIDSGNMVVRLSGLYSGDFKKKTEAGGYGDVVASDLTKMYTETLSTGETVPLMRAKKDSEGNKLPGGVWLATFPELAYAKTLFGSLDLKLRADVSYVYNTKAVVMYCLRRNLMSRISGICEVAGPKTVYNSAGPVHVTAVTESIAGTNKVLFTFRVNKVGGGRLLVEGANAFSETLADQNKVSVAVFPKVTVNADKFSCTNLEGAASATGAAETGVTGLLRLGESGEGIFTCALNTAGLDAEAVKAMEITLGYRYEESLPKTMTIKHIAG